VGTTTIDRVSRGYRGIAGRGALVAALLFGLSGAMARAEMFPAPPPETGSSSGPQTAVFAGGCFWGIEGVFERLKGVTDVVSGYSGGEARTAHYELVGTGRTGHAESVRITFDPKLISYGTLLEVFFSVAHDPTELNYQGPDHGTQYRSAIFYASDDQRRLAEAYIKKLEAAKIFPKPIVTQVAEFKGFYPAEDYHQDFMDRNPDYPYIVFWDRPKVARLEAEFPELVARK
jgi:peptide-methionine (S)-S-oxide reductase